MIGMPPIARSKSVPVLALALLIASSLTGCASYTTPPGGANLVKLAEWDIQKELKRQPASPFPANLAIVRVQGSAYGEYSYNAYGRGNFTVLTTHEIAQDHHLERIRNWPQIAGLAPINRMILPANLESMKQLRIAAARVHADLLLAYTFDTHFNIDDHDIPPLEVVTLGFLPNEEAEVAVTASAVIYDVRTGYIYGLAEVTAKQTQWASAWDQDDAMEDAQHDAEKERSKNYSTNWNPPGKTSSPNTPPACRSALPQRSPPHRRILTPSLCVHHITQHLHHLLRLAARRHRRAVDLFQCMIEFRIVKRDDRLAQRRGIARVKGRVPLLVLRPETHHHHVRLLDQRARANRIDVRRLVILPERVSFFAQNLHAHIVTCAMIRHRPIKHDRQPMLSRTVRNLLPPIRMYLTREINPPCLLRRLAI